MKACPKCRRLNADDAAVCADCGEDISAITGNGGAGNITMFGARPQPRNIVPLDHTSPVVAQTYAGRTSVSISGNSEVETHSVKEEVLGDFLGGLNASASAQRPKKPWER